MTDIAIPPLSHHRSGGRRAAAPLRCAGVLIACLAIAAVHSTPAQEADTGISPGLVIDEATLPLDALGQPVLDEVPGARDPEPLPADLEERLLELSEQRTAIGETSSSGAASAALGPLPGDADAPARRDSVDRDPDRLRALPPLPRAR
jgi:hypothetical protein